MGPLANIELLIAFDWFIGKQLRRSGSVTP